ncbi:MAG: hypothetical protein QM730_03350 [Anaerolineales bacterium]
MKAKNFLAMLLLSVSLAACSSFTFEFVTPAPAVTATSESQAMEMALASPTAWVGGTQTAQAVETQNVLPAEVTQEVTEKPVGFTPVLYGGKGYDSVFFFLLGGASPEGWISPEESVSRFSGEVTYSLSNMTVQAKYFLWGQSPQSSTTCKAYTIRSDAGLTESGFVGVVDGWAITKRPMEELSPDSEVYRQAVIDWLTEQGVSDPQLDVVHLYRVDLEGDGSDEIFISATHLDDSQHTTKAGDYSIILMRKVIGNDVATKLVVGDIYKSKELEITYPNTYSLANFIDLNQDGVLEVMVESTHWEGFGASLYEVNGENVEQVLSASCG